MLLTPWESPFAASAIGDSSVWVRPTGSQPCPKLATKSETRHKHPHSTGTGSPLPAPNSVAARGTCCWEEVPICTKHISVCLLEIHFFPRFAGYSLGLYVLGEEKYLQPASTVSCPFTTSPLTCLICEIKQLQSFKSLFIKCLQA